LAQAETGSSLIDTERRILREVLDRSPQVVHLQSGHGLDDVALVYAGAKSVVGIDYSEVAAAAAQRRANQLGVPCRYVVAAVPQVPLASSSTDLVYTGKGALIWMPDLDTWAREIVRLLRPTGHLFIYESHPAVPLWTWDADHPRIRGIAAISTEATSTTPSPPTVQWSGSGPSARLSARWLRLGWKFCTLASTPSHFGALAA
jgi:ubiquinone/menaquinone biosynthesis C-methylase UbiE